MKIIIELRLIVHKHSQKNNYDVNVDDISLPTYNLHFRKFKNNKNPNKLSIFGKNGSCHLSNLLQAHIFRDFSRTYT